MGTSVSPGQLAGKLNRLAQSLGDTRGPLNVTGMAGKRIFVGAAGPVIGATPAGRRKAVDVRYNVRRTKAGAGILIIAYTGPAHLLNNPTAPHFIGARRLGSRRRLAGLATGVGAVTAFGGTARGMFGSLGPASRTTRSGATRLLGKAALTIDSNLRAYAFHPGTKGKGFAQRAKAEAASVLPGIYGRAQLTEPLRRIF